MTSEDGLLTYLAGGGKLSAPENAPPRYRAELMRLMAVFVDSELAGATGFADCINLAPGVRERITAARIVVEKLGHAEKVLGLLEQFGANTAQYVSAHPWAARRDRSTDLGTRRIEGDMRLNVFHYPIFGWVDAIVLNYLMGRASVIQIDELAGCSYQPFADTMTQILPIEQRHAELGERGLRRVLAAGHDPVDAQASVNYWYRRVTATFGRAGSAHWDTYRRFGLRQHRNAELLARWQADVAPTLAELGLTVPQRP
jgi:1,2-phenylacetyl-CoA epoxidase catalytic subunit